MFNNTDPNDIYIGHQEPFKYYPEIETDDLIIDLLDDDSYYMLSNKEGKKEGWFNGFRYMATNFQGSFDVREGEQFKVTGKGRYKIELKDGFITVINPLKS